MIEARAQTALLAISRIDPAAETSGLSRCGQVSFAQAVHRLYWLRGAAKIQDDGQEGIYL